MAKNAAPKPLPEPVQASKKRKNPAIDSNNNNKTRVESNKKQKTQHFNRQRDARTLATQTSSKALQNGALDVDKFVQAREFEIRALERGIQRSGQANNRRAFQQVPIELRRRTASHNVMRVPKRLRGRASKEMIEDNTPTVNAKTRKPTRHMRLRLENVKKLRALGAKKKAERDKAEKVTVIDPNVQSGKATADKAATDAAKTTTTSASIKPRKPKSKVKKTAVLAKPPVPKSKFKKRQIHKSWLPTHLFHAKRAHMTPPSAPLWRFAIPLTPTQKCYRPTHRAAWERGCVAWDMSYMATIGLEGREDSILTVLKGLSVDAGGDLGLNAKWRGGRRAREVWAYGGERKKPIAPVEIIWCPAESINGDDGDAADEAKKKRSFLIRVHPSAFFQLWEEIIRLAKVAKPAVSVEDLRFEIGSIEITGPGSTEALLGALWPRSEGVEGSIEKTWTSLAGLDNTSLLPDGVQLAYNIQDPRLHHPPRTIKLPRTQEDENKIVQLAADWPLDKLPTLPPSDLFNHKSRTQNSKLPSQKAINRRKNLASPGAYPEALATDPKIPVLLYTSSLNQHQRNQRPSTSTWTLIAPWKTINAIWYSIQYYPLSTGQQPRFGGLDEKRQLAFEAGQPWFPGDFPGTDAGWAWEVFERRKRWEEWHKRPKGKRVRWEKVELGDGRKGELGKGWACDWSLLLGETEDATTVDAPEVQIGENEKTEKSNEPVKTRKTEPAPPPKPDKLTQMSTKSAIQLLKTPSAPPTNLEGHLVTVRISLLNKGVPESCARIYRLPSSSTSPELRKAWLALQLFTLSFHDKKKQQQRNGVNFQKNASDHVVRQRLAASLLEPPSAGMEAYPACPPAEDLIGFVTTGNFNLVEGKGTGIGSLLIGKVIEAADVAEGERKLCIVRNSGEGVGRLAMWEVV